jgi:hypothetical protein
MNADSKESIIPGQKPSELKKIPFIDKAFLQQFSVDELIDIEKSDTPWLFLSRRPYITPEIRAFFVMGCSVSEAMKHLFYMLVGYAHKDTSKSANLHDTEKLIKRQYLQGVELNSPDPAISKRLEQWRDEVETSQTKRCGKDWRSKQTDTLRDLTESDEELLSPLVETFPQEMFMVTNWMCWGDKSIGMGFFGKQVMIDVMTAVFPETTPPIDAERHYGERMRTRLKLKPYNSLKPAVIDSRVHRLTGVISVTYLEKGDITPQRVGGRKKLRREVTKNQCRLQGLFFGAKQIYPPKYYEEAEKRRIEGGEKRRIEEAEKRRGLSPP